MTKPLSRPFARAVLRRRAEGKPDILSPSEPRLTAELVNRGVARFKLERKGLPVEFAPVGRNHPDYGLTTEEHNAMKWARATGLMGNQPTLEDWEAFMERNHDPEDALTKTTVVDAPETVVEPITAQAQRLAEVGVEFASGGPVLPGQPYIVGEQSPELYVPDHAGYILPIKQEGGAE